VTAHYTSARGLQGLNPALSPLIGQLHDVFDHFQRVKKSIGFGSSAPPETEEQRRRAYDNPRDGFEQRKARMKTRNHQIAEANLERQLAAVEGERKRREELAHRELNQQKLRTCREIQDECNYVVTEVVLVCEQLQRNTDEFLKEPDGTVFTEGRARNEIAAQLADACKALDIERLRRHLAWIKEKNHQIKLLFVQRSAPTARLSRAR
jgi:hypothetical protein